MSKGPENIDLQNELARIGGFKALQDKLAIAANSLNPAMEALSKSLAPLATTPGAEHLRRALGGADRLNEIRNAAFGNSERWEQISRSISAGTPPLPPISMPRITPISDHLEKALRNQDRRQEAYRLRQAELLSEIAAAGREQNQTMIALVRLQDTLVNESLENSRVQRVVLIFSAASVLLSLLALVVAR